MRAGALARNIPRVSDEPHNIDLTVSVDQDSNDIRGHVTDVDGNGQRFSGWLELMSLIGAAREAPRFACSEVPDQETEAGGLP